MTTDSHTSGYTYLQMKKMSEVLTFCPQQDSVVRKLHISSENVEHEETVMDLSRDSSPSNPGSRHCDDSRTPSPAVNASPPVPNDPREWSRSDVSRWLQWATAFYSLDTIDLSKFAMNGRGLCLMTRQGFLERAPTSGDVLFSDFQRRVVISIYQNRPVYNGTSSSYQNRAVNIGPSSSTSSPYSK
ncbi:uncharacterized protein [Amphiura filiformis]|uniref:uncharacterized protein n=1 Tax=Amphiura filiformis TaxID=82378 RepID=UPI003B224360